MTGSIFAQTYTKGYSMAVMCVALLATGFFVGRAVERRATTAAIQQLSACENNQPVLVPENGHLWLFSRQKGKSSWNSGK